MSYCSVPGCSRPVGGGRMAARWGHLCNTHRSHDRRHGHPQQQSLTLIRLRPLLAAVERHRKLQPDHPLWIAADERWRTMVDEARAEMALYARGQPMSDNARIASEEIVKVAGEATPQQVWALVAAAAMMWEGDPTFFRNDEAAWVQTARLMRRLAYVNCAQSWDHQRRKTRRHYRDPNKAAMVVLGRRLLVTLGPVGLAVGKRQAAEDARRAAAKEGFRAALRDLEQPPEQDAKAADPAGAA